MRTDPDPAVASAALGALHACLLDAPEPAHHRRSRRVAAWPRLRRLDQRTRVLAVMSLQSWGQDAKAVMETDSDPLVRAIAALSPACVDSPQGTQALLEALSAPSAEGIPGRVPARQAARHPPSEHC